MTRMTRSGAHTKKTDFNLIYIYVLDFPKNCDSAVPCPPCDAWRQLIFPKLLDSMQILTTWTCTDARSGEQHKKTGFKLSIYIRFKTSQKLRFCGSVPSARCDAGHLISLKLLHTHKILTTWTCTDARSGARDKKTGFKLSIYIRFKTSQKLRFCGSVPSARCDASHLISLKLLDVMRFNVPAHSCVSLSPANLLLFFFYNS